MSPSGCYVEPEGARTGESRPKIVDGKRCRTSAVFNTEVNYLQYARADFIDSNGIRANFPRASKAGAKIVEEVTDRFYGDRRYRVEDLEGHEWAFAQAIKTK